MKLHAVAPGSETYAFADFVENLEAFSAMMSTGGANLAEFGKEYFAEHYNEQAEAYSLKFRHIIQFLDRNRDALGTDPGNNGTSHFKTGWWRPVAGLR